MELNLGFPMQFHIKETSSVCRKQLWYHKIPVYAQIFVFVVICAVSLGLIVYFTTKFSTNGVTSPSDPKPSSHIIKGLNKSVNPCEDFYQFACGSYNHQEYATEKVHQVVKAILEENSTNDLAPLKSAKNYYKLCLDANNKDPEVQYSNRISAFNENYNSIFNSDDDDDDELETVIAKLLKSGLDAFIQISVEINCPKDVCFPVVQLRKHKELIERLAYLKMELPDDDEVIAKLRNINI